MRSAVARTRRMVSGRRTSGRLKARDTVDGETFSSAAISLMVGPPPCSLSILRPTATAVLYALVWSPTTPHTWRLGARYLNDLAPQHPFVSLKVFRRRRGPGRL